jgi:hypothetical protein
MSEVRRLFFSSAWLVVMIAFMIVMAKIILNRSIKKEGKSEVRGP